MKMSTVLRYNTESDNIYYICMKAMRSILHDGDNYIIMAVMLIMGISAVKYLPNY